MKIRVMAVVLCACVLSLTVNAGDYLLKVDVIGFEDAPTSETDLKEKPLSSMEIIVREGMPFKTRMQIGPQALLLQGETLAKGANRFSTQVRFAATKELPVNAGDTGRDNRPLLDIVGADTSIVTELGQSIDIGSFVTSATDATSPQGRRSLHKIVFTLKENSPD